MYPAEMHILIRLQNLYFNKGYNKSPKKIYGRDEKYHIGQGKKEPLTFSKIQADIDKEQADYAVYFDEDGKPVIVQIE